MKKTEIIKISLHDLNQLINNDCEDLSIDVNLDSGEEISIERGDVDNVLVFDKDQTNNKLFMSDDDFRDLLPTKTMQELNGMKDLIDEEIEHIENNNFEKENPNLKNHNVSLNSVGIFIDDVLIDDEIRNNQDYEYDLRDREGLIEDLYSWIAEAQISRQTEAQMMKDDLEYLQELDDEYVFSSNRTNSYVAKSDDRKQFSEICEEILKLNAELKNKTKEADQ